MPLRGPFESPFGTRWGRLHAGVDIAVLQTNQVRAAGDGVVTAVGYVAEHGGYGNIVEIRHGPGLVTLYAHLETIQVDLGDIVQKGQPIAHAGCTGSCTGHASPFRGARARRAGRSAGLPSSKRSVESRAQGRLAQLGEHQLDKLGVTGSSPVPPTLASLTGAGAFAPGASRR